MTKLQRWREIEKYLVQELKKHDLTEYPKVQALIISRRFSAQAMGSPAEQLQRGLSHAAGGGTANTSTRRDRFSLSGVPLLSGPFAPGVRLSHFCLASSRLVAARSLTCCFCSGVRLSHFLLLPCSGVNFWPPQPFFDCLLLLRSQTFPFLRAPLFGTIFDCCFCSGVRLCHLSFCSWLTRGLDSCPMALLRSRPKTQELEPTVIVFLINHLSLILFAASAKSALDNGLYPLDALFTKMLTAYQKKMDFQGFLRLEVENQGVVISLA